MATALEASEQPLVESGASQQPLLLPAQLVAGVFLTGLAWEHVWRVVETVTDASPAVHLHRADLPEPTAPHVHSFAMHGGTGCECGHRVAQIPHLLPARVNAPRTHVLTPSGPIVTPDPYTIYTGTRRLIEGDDTFTLTRISGQTWPAALPIIPKLAVLWTLPAAARRLFGEDAEV